MAVADKRALTRFMGLRKINTIGIMQANKVVQLAATAYNLKKLLKFMKKDIQTLAMQARVLFFQYFDLPGAIFRQFERVRF